jgi:cell wall-active antibiotic response 4TMS protein YvqF
MTGPLILIVLGILFLLNNLNPDVYPFSRIWPVILVVIGVAKVLESIAHRSRGNKPPSGKESE